jgi:hypothetical protein
MSQPKWSKIRRCFIATVFQLRHLEGSGKPDGSEIKWDISAYADDVSLLGDNIDAIWKNTETLIDSNNVCIEVNIEKLNNVLIAVSSSNYGAKC